MRMFQCSEMSATGLKEQDDVSFYPRGQYCITPLLDKSDIPAFREWLDKVYDEYNRRLEKGR